MQDFENQTIRRSRYHMRRMLKQIKAHMPWFITAIETTPDYGIIHTYSRAIRGVAYYRCNYPTIRANTLTDIVVTDNVKEPARFTLKYRLFSSRFNIRYARVFNASAYRAIPSRRTPFRRGKAIFASADWLEREAWDLFGVYYKDSPERRRLLTDYGFDGHAGRKDFPVAGFIEYYYDPISGGVFREGVELNQEFHEYRDFYLPSAGVEFEFADDYVPKVEILLLAAPAKILLLAP